MKKLQLLLLAAALSSAAYADNKIGYEAADTIATVLKRHAGQKVELRLAAGDKLAGKIEAVGEKTVHLSALTGQEFFDAVVAIDQVSAVIIRTSGK